jgi:hypothetical protein
LKSCKSRTTSLTIEDRFKKIVICDLEEKDEESLTVIETNVCFEDEGGDKG